MAARKNKQQENEQVDEEQVAPSNPRLSASMPGAVVDHDQSRLAVREHTARLNGQGADAAAISAGGSASGDVDVATTPTDAGDVSTSTSNWS